VAHYQGRVSVDTFVIYLVNVGSSMSIMWDNHAQTICRILLPYI